MTALTVSCSHSLATFGQPCPHCGTVIVDPNQIGRLPALTPPPPCTHGDLGEHRCHWCGTPNSQIAPSPAPTIPHARRTDPATSHTAAARARTRAAINRDRVLIAHADAGDAGLTGDELEQALGDPYEVVGPRRPGLERADLLTKAGQRPNRRGNPEQVYVITDTGRMEAARAHIRLNPQAA